MTRTLKDYARHDDRCEYLTPRDRCRQHGGDGSINGCPDCQGLPVRRPCTCGLTALLQSEAQTPPSPKSGMDEWQAKLGWPALKSSLKFADERIKCMRHTEAVADCEHCQFSYIVGWVKRHMGEAQTPAWQEIESAPKDGTDFLASDGAYTWITRWHTCRTTEVSAAGTREYISFDNWQRGKPTHWLPLPAPPSAKGDYR